MARLNEILVGRFNRAFQKVYGIKGPPPVATLAPEIMPVHNVYVGVEHRFNESWGKWATAQQATGAAGNLSVFRIRNPVGSNMIAVLEKIAIFSATTQIISLQYGPVATDLVGNDVSVPLDVRQPATQGSALKVSKDTNTPAALNLILNVPVTAADEPYDTITEEQHELTLPPGGAVQLTAGTIATSISWAVWWRERFLEEGERI